MNGFDEIAFKCINIISTNSELFREANEVTSLNYHCNGSFVLNSEAGLILEAPGSLSVALPALSNSIPWGKTWLCGENFTVNKACSETSLLQIVFVKKNTAPTSTELSLLAARRSLANCVPGYMAESIGSQIEIKIHRNLLNAGFSLEHLAMEIRKQFGQESLIILGINAKTASELFGFLAEQTQILKNSLKKTTDKDCDGTDCASCDESIICDKIRVVLKSNYFSNNVLKRKPGL